MIIPTTLFFPSYHSHTREQMNLGVKEAKEETKLKVKEMTGWQWKRRKLYTKTKNDSLRLDMS